MQGKPIMARIKAKPAIKRLPIAPVGSSVQVAKTAPGFGTTPPPAVFDPATYSQSARYIYPNGAAAIPNVSNAFGVHMIVSFKTN